MSLAELLQAFRRLRQQPLFAISVVGVLALAIGANTAMFSLVDAVLLRPLPLGDPGRLIAFAIVRPGTDRQPLSIADAADFEARARTLSGVASLFGWSVNVTGGGEAERLQGMRVSANYFDVTGSAVAIGRAIQRSDEQERVAVLSHGLWRRRFGGDPGVIGRAVVLNGDAFTIIGVLRPDFVSLVRDVDLVAPYSPASDVRRANRAQGFLRVIARLAPAATFEQAAEDLQAVGRQLRAEYPDSHGTDTGVRVAWLHDEISGRAAPMLRLLLGAVVLVLIVACANLANLFLVRATSRRRELAVRAALGASKGRIVLQMLIEAAALGLAGGAVGLLVARVLVDALIVLGQGELPRIALAGIDLRVAAFTVLASLGASLLFGIAPALHAARGDVREGLQGGERAVAGGSGRLRAWLVFAEVALSTVLLVAAALLGRSFARVQAVDPGFRASHVLTIRLSLPRIRYAGHDAIGQFYDQVAARVAALPGIRAIAAGNVVPMNGYLATTPFSVDGMSADDLPDAHYRMISPDYFRALGIALRSGRAFSAADRSETQAVAIVNETFARLYLAGRSPIGARIRLDDGEKPPRVVEVVGVVGDVRHFGLEKETTLEIYVPIAQVPDPTTIWLANNMYLVIQTEGAPLGAAQAVRREIAAVDSGVPASFVRSMDQWLGASVAPRRFNLVLVEAFAAAALLLAVVGVYATAASAVAARRREIGIRAALGASKVQVIALVATSGLVPVAAGLLAGVAAAPVVGRMLSGMLFGVSPRDPISLAAVVVTLAGAGIAATAVPARRAARVDPIVALRPD